MQNRRAVLTGLGVITPLGSSLEKFWTGICQGESGISRITKFDPRGFDCQIASEVKDFDPLDFIPKKDILVNFV